MNIKTISEITGVSARTLRHYEEIGLLNPKRNEENDYRNYDQSDIDRLQQILIYKQLGFRLSEIKQLLIQPKKDVFESQLGLLKEQAKDLQKVINNLEKYIKGEDLTMKEQFEGLEKVIEENEQKYGKEVREKYGDEDVDNANEHLRQGGEMALKEAEILREKLNVKLKELVDQDISISSPKARELFELHKQWLKIYYPGYNSAYHRGLADMYEADERFAKNYNDVVANGNAYMVAVIRQFAK